MLFYALIYNLVFQKSQETTRYDTHLATQQYEDDVCLIYSKCDSGLASHVRHFLEEDAHQKLKVSIAELPEEGPNVVEKRIRAARWILLFISRESLQNSNCIPLWLAELLSISVEERRLRVIPILVDVEPTDVPNFIRAVTYINAKDKKNYRQRILQAVEGL